MTSQSRDPGRKRIDFYAETIDRWIPNRSASILVVGGGPNDEGVFRQLGFTNVTLTNVHSAVERAHEGDYALAVADAENLPFPDESFDYTVVHAVLHHCRSPHRGLLELYRVARKAAIFFEARDSLSMRMAERLGLLMPYEVTAVVANGGTCGGVVDTEVPNYVYRWTEREVEKTIASFAPHARHVIRYARGFGMPCEGSGGAGFRRVVRRMLLGAYRVFVTLVPSQRNLFACEVQKPTIPGDLQRWLEVRNGDIRFRG